MVENIPLVNSGLLGSCSKREIGILKGGFSLKGYYKGVLCNLGTYRVMGENIR